MSEDKLKDLLQQDQNLRDAIRQEEAERPQMPADLNARLMQRVSAGDRREEEECRGGGAKGYCKEERDKICHPCKERSRDETCHPYQAQETERA